MAGYEHTIIKTIDGKQFGVESVHSPGEEIAAVKPVLLTDQVRTSDPVASTRPQFFFRMSGGKMQVCTRFPSGAIQIIATEP